MSELPQRIEDILADGDFYIVTRLDSCDEAGQDFSDCDDFVHNFTGKILLCGYTGEPLAEIGTFDVYQIDGDGLLAQGLSIYQAYDLTQETFEYYEDLVNIDNEWYFNDTVLEALNCEDESLPSGMLIISELEIAPGYRGRRLGLRALMNLMLRFRPGAGLIAMRPFPLQHAKGITDEQLQEWSLTTYKGSERACLLKLRAHFGKLGFKLIPGTDVMAVATIRKWENLDLDCDKSLRK